MRRLANENPTMQIALIGILVLVCGFLLYTRVLSSESGSGSTTATTTPSTTEAVAPAPGTSEELAAPETPAPAGSTVSPETAPQDDVPPSALEPGKGLPESVVKAYGDGDAIVLLVVRQSGLDDRPVEAAVRALEGRPDLSVFVTGAKNIARYARVTQGVNVSRVPALVVLQPRSISGAVPHGSVSYGFRSPQSVLQAVRDALYKGGKVPYHPE